MIKAALVLQGGSLRTVYTSGVLDVFMENGIEFECVIGISAGALIGANYIAKHIGNSARINIMHSNDSNFYGIKQYLLKGSIFNFDYLFYSPIKELYPYDEKALENTKQRFIIGATNCASGQIEYFEKYNYKDMVKALQASCTIPLLCKPVNLEGNLYIDGGVAEPFGLHKAFSEGYDKVVVILTRDKDYIRKKNSLLNKFFINWYKKRYPELMNKISFLPEDYNSLMKSINQMEKDQKIFIIRPDKEIKISKIERNARKLVKLYLDGRDSARKSLPKMFEYLKC
jgi:predicted patatin/cPLA2 family phospholipase